MTEPIRPLQVYLDSSDFSNLATPCDGAEDVAKVWARLACWQQAGDIQLRYSCMHVLEMAPQRHAPRSPGVQRLQFLWQACKRHCLIDFRSLIDLELAALRGGPIVRPSGVASDVGHWYPETIRRGDEEDDSPGLGTVLRMQMRQRWPEAFDETGQLRTHALPVFNFLAEGAVAAYSAKVPGLEPEELAVLMSCYTQDAPISRFTSMLALDLRLLAVDDIVFDVSDALRSASGPFLEPLLRAVEAFREREARNPATFDGTRRLLLGRNKDGRLLAGLLAGRQVGDHSSEEAAPSWECSPAIMVAVALAQHLMATSVVKGRSGRIPVTNDFADLLHALYFPYVDIFRADRFVAAALRQADCPVKVAVVESFVKLPSVIEDRLTTRATAGTR